MFPVIPGHRRTIKNLARLLCRLTDRIDAPIEKKAQVRVHWIRDDRHYKRRITSCARWDSPMVGGVRISGIMPKKAADRIQ